MLVLAIESSCDETSLAILKGGDDLNADFYSRVNSFEVLSSVISSQVEIHRQFGGVVPEVGARAHADQIHSLFLQVVNQAQGKTPPFLDKLVEQDLEFLSHLNYIYVTSEPGLVSALRVGLEFAKTLQYFIHEKTGKFVEIKKVNHLKGHVVSSFFYPEGSGVDSDQQVFPHLHLLVSGGHTQLIYLNCWSDWKIIGQTLDDAAGETFDKVGRMLGFPYPGGVFVSKVAGDEYSNYMDFPVSMKNKKGYDFSYSGLKTSIRYHLQKLKVFDYSFEKKLSSEEVETLLNGGFDCDKLKMIKEVSISAQSVIVGQLVNNLKKAIEDFDPVSIGISGGVSANPLLRRELLKISGGRKIFMPDLALTGDNAVMIGLAGIVD